MNEYKKKSLQFCDENYCRKVIRHGEALKVRESSRFKRLSMIRDINDSDLETEEMEPIKSDAKKVEVVKPTMSRLDMLFKYKQEKQLRKELEIRQKKKPFYIGGSTIQPTIKSNKKTSQNMKSSFMDQANTNFTFSKSKLLVPKAPSLPSKLPNFSRQLVPKAPPLPSKLPNFSRQINYSTQKQLGFANKGNNASGLPKTITKSCNNFGATVNQQGSIPKVVSRNVDTSVTKHTPNGMKLVESRCAFPKVVNQASSIQRFVNNNGKKLVKNLANEKNVTVNVASVKTINQVSSLPKSTLTKFSNKSVVKGSLPKITPTKFSNKSNQKIPGPIAKPPVFKKKIPVPNRNQKNEKPAILQMETSLHKKNTMTRKGYCFKEAVAEYANALKQDLEKSNREIKDKYEVAQLSEQSLGNIPDVSLNCDISIIKPASNSFAPDNFKFIQPAALSGFTLDDDDDPYEALERVQLKFMSRTSTPTKAPEQNLSSNCLDSPLVNIKISPEKSVRDNDAKRNVNEKNIKVENMKEENINGEKLINEENINEEKYIDEENTSENKESIDDQTNVKEDNDINKKNINEEKYINEENTSENKESIDDQNNVKEDNDINKKNINEKNAESDILKLDNNDHIKIDTYEELSASPFDIIDLNNLKVFEGELELMNLEDDKANTIDFLEKPECVRNKEERKPAKVHKRVSFLKNVSMLNAIAEADDCPVESLVNIPKDNVNSIITPRRSKRLSAASQQQLNILTENILEENTPHCSGTPRRSLRLQKKNVNLEIVGSSSPFEQRKSTSKIVPRRSMRLIDLNTPEKDTNDQSCSKSNLTVDFQKLNLLDCENKDPNAILIDLNSPGIVTAIKPRKVSLLYTPEKNRKSVRKSVKGDLMAFSPSS